MRSLRITLLALLALGPGLSQAAGKADPSWEKLKSLVGDWEGRFEGQPARVSYKLVSSGKALLETMETHDSNQMVTLYHPDGASLLLTHYCSMGNQSRLRATGMRDGRLDFSFVDVTNLQSPDEHRMTRLVLSLPDATHLVQEWTSRDGAKEHVGRFEYTRTK